MKRKIKPKGILLSLLGVIILGVVTIFHLLYHPDWNSRNDSDNGHANQTLCYSHMLHALQDIKEKTISNSADFQKNWCPRDFTEYVCCPVSGKKYLFSPDLISWPDDNEIVIICPFIHPVENRKSNEFLAITFGGSFTKASILPNWENMNTGK